MLLNFDFDGVVIDSFERLLAQCRAAQFELDEGRPPTAEDFRTIENLTFADLAGRLGMSAENGTRFETLVYQIQEADPSTCPLVPGIGSVLRSLAESHIITVVTSSDSAAVEAELKRHDLGWPVVARVLGPDFAKAKRDRIQQAQSAFSFDRGETYMIGDAISDIREGRAAGVKTIAVTWGFQDRTLLANEEPTHLVDHPEELLDLLQVE
ncbi:HAD family hydrolase [Gimesia panareensis]|uniref:HAD family hydrolase n=1 Tax=Gimesia panareensis TaxID=2527978 RepID=UPI0011888321|nr:HAD family hydrolase [Gimesia panareensis]QDU51220.1 Pyrophosphatase PpaX [Gimesia panareensis]